MEKLIQVEMRISTNKRIAVLSDNGFEELELKSPKAALEAAGVKVDIISPNKGKIRSWDFIDWGPDYKVDVELSQADPSLYDGLILPGGVINPDLLRVNPEALAFIKHFTESNKLIASICHGPWPLIELDYLKGKNITSYKSISSDLKNAGANWIDSEVVQDGNLITSRTPNDLEAFNKRIIEVIVNS